MSRLSDINAAASLLAGLSPEDRALAIEGSGTRRRRRGGAKPGPKPGTKRKVAAAPARKAKAKSKSTTEGKAEKAKRLIGGGDES